ncbi:MAG: cell wall anchor protein, partial [Lactococcus sp.]
ASSAATVNIVKVQPLAVKAAAPTLINRFYNTKTGQHLWTTSTLEALSVTGAGWISERNTLTSVNNGTAVYRMYNAKTGDHFYTTSVTERNNAIKNLGYKSEGVAFDVANTGVTVYRLYNATLKLHLYTTELSEVASVIKKGYKLEGPAWKL